MTKTSVSLQGKGGVIIKDKIVKISIVLAPENCQILANMLKVEYLHNVFAMGILPEMVALCLQDLYLKVAKKALTYSKKVKLHLSGTEAFALLNYCMICQFTDKDQEYLAKELVRIIDSNRQ